MVIPTFERSLDLVFDNEFELSEEEIDNLLTLLGNDENLLQVFESLIQGVDTRNNENEQFKTVLKDIVHSHTSSIEKLYDAIIGNPKVISYIQDILIKRLI